MSCELGGQHVCCTRIEHLSVKVGNEFILNDVNLHLHCGELTAIVGRNGAGKTTFLRALLDEIPHTGTITFEGERCADHCINDHTIDHAAKCNCHVTEKYVTTKPRFGYVPQRLSVEAGCPVSVEDFVLSCMSNRPVWMRHRAKDKALVKEILSATNSGSLGGRRVSDLSGGEIQRVLLALAIHPVPDILLLDEPVSGVDRNGLKVFYELVSSLRRDYDITILLISHDLDLVARHADRVVLIDRGIACQGTVDEVYKNEAFIETFGHIIPEKKGGDADDGDAGDSDEANCGVTNDGDAGNSSAGDGDAGDDDTDSDDYDDEDDDNKIISRKNTQRGSEWL